MSMRAAAASAVRKQSLATEKLKQTKKKSSPASQARKNDSSDRPTLNVVAEGFKNLERLEPPSPRRSLHQRPLTTHSIGFDPEKAFRVKFSEWNNGKEGCVYYKDDEDRFTQR